VALHCRLLFLAHRAKQALQQIPSASHSVPKMIRPIVMSGPSGGGKSTILARAIQEYPNTFAFSISHTTRNPRNGEIPGEHYHFVSKDEVKSMIENNEFFEHAEFGGNTYGTSKKAVSDIQRTGRICVLDVELTGVKTFKKSDLNAKYILIQAPSIDILEERLRNRGSETEESIAKRLKRAREDSEAVKEDPTLFDYVIVNSILDVAYANFIEAIADELKQFKATRPHEIHSNGNGNENGHSHK